MSERKPLRWNRVRHSLPPTTATSVRPLRMRLQPLMMAFMADEQAVDTVVDHEKHGPKWRAISSVVLPQS